MPNSEEFFEYLKWRQTDCLRNGKGHMGYAYLKSSVHRVSANDIIRRVYDEHKISWHTMPFWYKEGVLLKKQKYTKVARNGLTGMETSATRARVVACNGLLADQSDEGVAAVASKFLEETAPVVRLDPSTGGTLGTVTSGPVAAKDAPLFVVKEDYDFFSLADPSAFPAPLAAPRR